MVDGRQAGRGIRQTTGNTARVGDHFLDVIERGAGIGRKHQRRIGSKQHRCQVFADIETELGIHVWRDGVLAHCRHQEGVTIGRSLGHMLGANHTAATNTVFHQHLLLPDIGQLGADQARGDICHATRRIGRYQPHRLGRPFLRLRRLRQHEQRNSGRHAEQDCWHRPLEILAALAHRSLLNVADVPALLRFVLTGFLTALGDLLMPRTELCRGAICCIAASVLRVNRCSI